MTRFETIFFDVGGVCLTNGRDTSARRSAALRFSLDLEEFEERTRRWSMPSSVTSNLSTAISIASYSSASVLFARRLHQIHADAIAAARPGAEPGPEPRISGLLQARHDQQRVARAEPLSHPHVSAPGPLLRVFQLLLPGGPQARRADLRDCLDVMQAAAATSLFVDDREENVEGARALGIHAIDVTDLRGLAEQLMQAGVEDQTTAREE